MNTKAEYTYEIVAQARELMRKYSNPRKVAIARVDFAQHVGQAEHQRAKDVYTMIVKIEWDSLDD